ncbi:hypothetical protein BMS3Abin17_01392 [archaeon BMS3Abin17]|nr:hypothetical protein BMS3Abin17_01392 [archaeon BMS3Abin17]HDZ61045.1 hypothetical protein [Candidatus Pacearchaeota archaeon]
MKEIKYAEIKDAEGIFEIMQDVKRTAYTLDLVKDLINTHGSLSLKLIIDGKIIGALGARAEGRNSGWLYYIVVHQKVLVFYRTLKGAVCLDFRMSKDSSTH